MKIIVVGAGPAGSFVSYLLANQGHEVTLIEEHSEIGLPVQCTGIVTATILELLKIPSHLIKTQVHRARIFSLNKHFVEIPMKIPNLILNRTDFDKYLAEKANNAGVKLLLSHRFIGKDNDQVTIKNLITGQLKKFSPDLVVGADGPNSSVAKIYGFAGKRNFFLGAQATVKMEHEEVIDFYPISEGIGWSVPEGNGLFRIGVAVYHKPHETLQKFLLDNYPNNKIIEYQAGLIPIYNPNLQIEKNNVCLIGDAATQVKATTCGGIIQSLLAAKSLAHSIETGESYTKNVKRALGNELWLHLEIRQLMNKFNESDYNNLIEYSNNPKITSLLSANDRDKLFSFFFKMLFYEPRYFKLLACFLRR